VVSGVQIEISDYDCASNHVHVLSRFFRPFGAFGARQKMFLERRKLGFVFQHSKVITLQVVVGKVVHARIVVRPGEILTELLRADDYDECRMVCSEKVRLVGEYSVASSALVIANTKLKAARDTGVGVSGALGVWKAASAKCVETRQALQEHKANHGC